MRVLHVVPSLSKEWGGTTFFLFNLVKNMNECTNSDVDVVSTVHYSEKESIHEYFLDNPHVKIFDTNSNALRYSRRLNGHLKRCISKYDVVHIHGVWTFPVYFALRYCKSTGTPCILSPHGMLQPWALRRSALKKLAFYLLFLLRVKSSVAAVCAITDSEKKCAEKILLRQRKYLIPHGANVKGIFNEKKKENNMPVLYVGRLHPVKGIDRLLHAFVGCHDYNLTIAGDGDNHYKESLKKMVADLNLQKRVRFVGFADEEMKVDLFSNSQFIVIPSHTEVKSLVAIEALSSGLPVLITQACDFSEIIEYDAGYVVKDNSVLGLSEGIRYMLKSDLNMMSTNALRLSSDKFDWRVIIKKYEKMYLDMRKDNVADTRY